ncbi:bacterioferritin [Natranaerobius thermophilus]|uniref:Bacterioferritin n=1 Tax=Natranaerobius thermophilus (strain ATCC BAA-1301 / DSM 18059 / JW/NM-WN-LF) TaxID=457570 RepID=B2A7E5_NATTJ|nr:bacterioferritin [Natranaerobius thermophilus]ACB85654.1 Ferritin Dps family protein [Natranaerobius thermophilus JW/NM-WN-LF]
MSKQNREQKKQKVIEVLNKARSMELQAIHQYMNQHYSLDDKDYGEFATKIRTIAIDEMRHAETFAERVKELDGEPTTELAGGVEKNQDVEKIFPFDSEQEEEAIETYNEFAQICRENNDTISAKLFETIIEEEQQHQNYFDDIDDHIKNLGNTYLARMVGTAEGEGGEE